MYAVITFTGMTSAALIKNGVYAVIAFTGMPYAAFVENGVYAVMHLLVCHMQHLLRMVCMQ